jgi:threonine dehydratase
VIAHNVDRRDRPPAPDHLALDHITAAARRLDGVAHRTPVITSRTLDDRLGARFALKAETFQRVGAFKFRGAYNAVSSLDAEALGRGVCTASSGNHAQALALASRLCGTRATIIMPADAPPLKRAATVGYGAEVISYDRYAEDREQLLQALAAERSLEVIHPYDDPRVMAGQGTLVGELLDDAEDLDVLVVPVGGGGLISGCATAMSALRPSVRIVGVEPEASDDVARSLQAGERRRVTVSATIADGQQTESPGERTWPVIRALVDEVHSVTDPEILTAMRFCFERLKLVVEPSGATALAALLSGSVAVAGERVGVVLSGGNADPAVFARALGAG